MFLLQYKLNLVFLQTLRMSFFKSALLLIPFAIFCFLARHIFYLLHHQQFPRQGKLKIESVLLLRFTPYGVLGDPCPNTLCVTGEPPVKNALCTNTL